MVRSRSAARSAPGNRGEIDPRTPERPCREWCLRSLGFLVTGHERLSWRAWAGQSSLNHIQIPDLRASDKLPEKRTSVHCANLSPASIAFTASIAAVNLA